MVKGALVLAGLLVLTDPQDVNLRPQIEEQLVKCWDVANGGLVDGADYSYVDKAEELIKQLHGEGLKKDFNEMTHAIRVELDKLYEPKLTYYGNCRITFYCNCVKCCGKWAGSPTASGAMPRSNRTVATGSDLPFGAHLVIDGVEYVVEDRGVSNGCVDIYVDSHDEAVERGLYYTDVYIKEG